MKKLLKNVTLGLALAATSLSFGQINLSVSSTPTKVSLNGTLDTPLVFTITDIPSGTTNTMNLRLYDNTSGSVNVTIGGQLAQLQVDGQLDLNSTTPDVDVDEFKTETTDNGSTIDVKYTIRKITLTGADLTDGTSFAPAVRLILGGSGTVPAAINPIPGGASETPTGATLATSVKHIIYQFSDVTADATLSTSIVKGIDGASLTAENGSITASGAEVDAVYSITGQQVGAENLSNGVYIVKISKGNKQDVVKVILD